MRFKCEGTRLEPGAQSSNVERSKAAGELRRPAKAKKVPWFFPSSASLFFLRAEGSAPRRCGDATSASRLEERGAERAVVGRAFM